MGAAAEDSMRDAAARLRGRPILQGRRRVAGRSRGAASRRVLARTRPPSPADLSQYTKLMPALPTTKASSFRLTRSSVSLSTRTSTPAVTLHDP